MQWLVFPRELCSGEASFASRAIPFFRHAIERANDLSAGNIVIMNFAVLFQKLDKIVIRSDQAHRNALRTAGLNYFVSVDQAGNCAVTFCGALIVCSRQRRFGRLRRDRKRRERRYYSDSGRRSETVKVERNAPRKPADRGAHLALAQDSAQLLHNDHRSTLSRREIVSIIKGRTERPSASPIDGAQASSAHCRPLGVHRQLPATKVRSAPNRKGGYPERTRNATNVRDVRAHLFGAAKALSQCVLCAPLIVECHNAAVAI